MDIKICEVCHKNEATRFLLKLGIKNLGHHQPSGWSFVCEYCEETTTSTYTSYPICSIDKPDQPDSYNAMIERYQHD